MIRLIEGKDYYWEEIDGVRVRVFTEEYHENRGFCCNNKCRHCAFRFKEELKKNNKNNSKKTKK